MRRQFLALTLVAGLAACGDDDKKSPPDTTQTDTTQTDTAQPDTAQPDTTQPDTTQPDTTQPDTTQPDTTQPDTAQPDTTEPDTTQTDTTEPAALVIKRGDRCSALSAIEDPKLPFADAHFTVGASDDYVYTTGTACGGPIGQGISGDASPDVVYTVTPAITTTYRISLTPATGVDMGLMVTDACPPKGEDEFDSLTCLGTADRGIGVEELSLELTAGQTYYFLVDGFSNDTAIAGTYSFNIAIGENCTDGIDNDDNGKVDCEDSQCSATAACDESAAPNGCHDGIDNDNNGVKDCADPNCATATGCNEATYPNGCTNGQDDDGDGDIDCDDSDCAGTRACMPAGTGDTCAAPMALAVNTPQTLNTCSFDPNFTASAAGGCVSQLGAPDVLFSFTATTAGTYRVAANANWSTYEMALNLVKGSCPAAGALATCAGSARNGSGTPLVGANVDLAVGDTLYAIVGGTSTGTYKCGDVTVTLTTVEPEICTDGVDNDGNGKVDCADEVCFGIDGCPTAPPGESCESAIALTLGTQITRNTTGMTPNFTFPDGQGCKKNNAASPDLVFSYTATETGSYKVDFASLGSSKWLYANVLTTTPDVCVAAAPTSCTANTFSTGSGALGKATFEATAGDKIWIVVGGYYSSGVETGEFNLKLTKLGPEICDNGIDDNDDGRTDCFDRMCYGVGSCPANPPGETCESALPLTSGVEVTGTTVGAATDFTFVSGQGCSVSSAEAGDLLYKYTVTQTGSFKLDFTSTTSGKWLFANVVTTSGGACPVAAPAGCLTNIQHSGSGTPTAGRFNATAGDTVWIVIGSYFSLGDEGAFKLKVTALAPEICNDTLDNDQNGLTDCQDPACRGTDPACPIPQGDACANPFVATFAPGTTTTRSVIDTCTFGFDTTFTGTSCKYPSATTTTPKDVVTRFVAPESGNYYVELQTGLQGQSTFSTYLNVVRAATCPTGSVTTCDAAESTTTNGRQRVSVYADAGETFLVYASGQTTAACGKIAVSIWKQGTEICNDSFDNNGNDFIDCADTTCQASPFCSELANGDDACRNEIDDDGNGYEDCYDATCATSDDCPNGLIGNSCAAPLLVDLSVTGQSVQTFNTCSYTSSFKQSSNSTCKSFGAAGDVLAKLVIPADGNYKIELRPQVGDSAYYDATLNVIKADTCPTGAIATCFAGVDNGSSAAPITPENLKILNAVAGETYWIIADSWNSTATTACGAARLTVTQLGDEVCDDGLDNNDNGLTDCVDPTCYNVGACGGPPEGESCETATVLTSGVEVQGDTTGKVPNFTFPDGQGCKLNNTASPDLLFTYEVTADGPFKLDLTSIGASRYLYANVVATTGGACVANAPAACAANATSLGSGALGTTTFNATAGQTLWITVGGFYAGTPEVGAFKLKLTAVAPEICDDTLDNDGDGQTDCGDSDCYGVGECPDAPVGEGCANPWVLTAGSITTVTTCDFLSSFTTTAAGGCGAAGVAKDVTFSFTAPTAGTYTFEGESDWLDLAFTANIISGSACNPAPTQCTATFSNSYDSDYAPTTASTTLTLAADETVWIIFDSSFSTDCGPLGVRVTAP